MIHRFSVSGQQPLAGTNRLDNFRSDVERDYPLIQQHDEASADVRRALQNARELVYVTGGELQLFHRTDNADIDNVWQEDPNPTYWPPVTLKGRFEPKSYELLLKSYGSDAPLKLKIHFSLLDLVERFGERVIRPGDALKLRYNSIGLVRPRYFRVLNAAPSESYRYVWLYLACDIESISGDVTVLPESQHQPLADYNE